MKKIDYKKRAKKILELRKSGWSLQKIGNKFGITRERVRQILLKYFGLKGRVKRVIHR